MSFHSHSLFCFAEDAAPFGAKSRPKGFPNEADERERFIRAMWRAFPDARSENDLAELVAIYLRSIGRRASPKTVRNWLAKDNAPHFRYVAPILARIPEPDRRAFMSGWVQ